MMIEQTEVRWRVWKEPLEEEKESGEQGRRLKEWLDERGIKAVLFDLDDTLVDLESLVRKQKESYADYVVSRLPNLNKTDVLNQFNRIHALVYQKFAVNPLAWDVLSDELAHYYGNQTHDVFREATSILHDLYSQVPELIPGARETVQMFRGALKKMGLVTHAPPSWTRQKLNKTGLYSLFDHVQIVDVTQFKGSDDWKSALNTFGVKPEEVLVVGDSLSGDIRPAHDIGVKHIVWIPSPWAMFTVGDMPPGVIRVNTIKDVIPALLQIK